MMEEKNHRQILTLNHRLFFLLLLMIPLYLFKNPAIRLLGYGGIAGMVLLSIHTWESKLHILKVNRTWAYFFLYSSYMFMVLVRNPSGEGLYSWAVQGAMLLFIGVLSSLTINEGNLRTLMWAGKTLGVIVLIPASLVALRGGGNALFLFDGLYSFVFYKFMLVGSFFFFATAKHKIIPTLFFSMVFLMMTERTSAFVLLIIYGVYVLIGIIRKIPLLYKALFLLAFISLVGFTYLYVQLQYMDIGRTLNSLFREYTGGNFFSGRNRIWEVAFEAIEASWLFGNGFNHGVLQRADIQLSTHNTYIYLLLQGGVVALGLFGSLLYSIWKSYYRYLYDPIVRSSAAYFIGILVFTNFEVTLIANTVGLSLLFWLVLGVGLMRKNYLKDDGI